MIGAKNKLIKLAKKILKISDFVSILLSWICSRIFNFPLLRRDPVVILVFNTPYFYFLLLFLLTDFLMIFF